MGRLIGAALLAVATLSATVVAADIPKCGPGLKCPASAPCCSAYGQCGVGAYCLGGCDPLFSNTLSSCVPNPVCQSQDYAMKSTSDIQDISKYLGDNSKANWQASGRPLAFQNQGVLLTMAPDTVGTLLASTNYVWYGKICAKMTTSQGKGVVTAFIMMSDVKDEIDFEWVGVDTQNVQSNYYSQGITNYNNGANLTASNTASSLHEYCIDWTPDSITWLVDGERKRVKNRSDTWNRTSNRYDYPQTPSRVMISLWPAGLPSNAKGTVDWAGGLIDWNSQYMQNGYYYALLNSVSVQCYDPPSGTKFGGGKSYVYTDAAGTNNTIAGSDKIVILKSLLATGDNPNYDPYGTSATQSGGSKPSMSAVPESVPGVSGTGVRADGQDGQSSTDSLAGGSAGSNTQSSSSGGFSQGGSSNSNSRSGAAGSTSALKNSGSVFAVLVAVAGLFYL